MNSRVKRLLVSVTVSACIDWGLSLYVKSYLITILTVPDFYSTIDTWSMVSVLVDPSVWRMLLVFVSPSPDVVWLGNNRETAHFINIILASVTTRSTHSNGCQVVHWPCQRHRVPVRKIFALRLFVVDICQDLLILCTMLVLILCHFHSTFSTGQGLILSFPSSRKQGNIRYYSSYLYLSLKLNLNAIIFCSLRRCQIAIHNNRDVNFGSD